MTALHEFPHGRLATVFLYDMPDAERACFVDVSRLEDVLVRLVEAGRAAWPDIPLAERDFVAFVGRLSSGSGLDGLAALHAADLWLACGYGRGLPGAIDALEAQGFVSVGHTLGRLGAPRTTVADILQGLRSLLVEMQAPPPNRKLYAGRGDLVGWLRVCAVREFNQQRKGSARELQLETMAVPEPPLDEPELHLLLRTHKEELTQAFQHALASMSNRERNVLRCYFVEELSIDRIGALYGVHRSTAARWVGQARETLAAQTRAMFRERVSMSDEGFLRILALIESRIQVELAKVGDAVT